jgi:hypothetical protein
VLLVIAHRAGDGISPLGPRLFRDYEIQRVAEIERAANGKPSHFDMDDAFCARMLAAIEAGLVSAPTSVITAPGTKNLLISHVLACFTCLLDFRDGYYARSRLLAHLGSDDLDYWCDRLFHFPRSLLR